MIISRHLQQASLIEIDKIHRFFNDYGYASYEGDDFPAFFNKPPYQFICLFDDEALIGVLLFSLIDKEAEIIEIAVAQKWRRQGMGKQLISELISLLKSQHCERLLLEVADTNEAAKSLYESYGFAICGRRSGYYQRITGDNMKKIDAAIMELWLLKV